MPSSVLIARENGRGDPPDGRKTSMMRSTNPAVSVVTYETGLYPTIDGNCGSRLSDKDVRNATVQSKIGEEILIFR